MSNNPLVPAGGLPVATITDELTSAAGYARDSSSPATLKAYASDWRDFSAWCAPRKCPALPASVETTAGYLAHLADSGRKVSTITRRAAAIAYAHRLRCLAPPTAAEPVKAVLRGIRRRLGLQVERKAPATARAISKMLAKIPSTRKGVRDRALLLIGFAAALRRSELVDLKVNDIERTAGGILLHIRSSKTDQEGEGHAIAIPAGSKLKPLEALDAWLELRGDGPGPLFGICDATVALIVKRYARKARLDPARFSGHSLRAGFVTSALEHGADLFKIMDITRHRRVETLREYDRRAKAFKNHAGKGFL